VDNPASQITNPQPIHLSHPWVVFKQAEPPLLTVQYSRERDVVWLKFDESVTLKKRLGANLAGPASAVKEIKATSGVELVGI